MCELIIPCWSIMTRRDGEWAPEWRRVGIAILSTAHGVINTRLFLVRGRFTNLNGTG